HDTIRALQRSLHLGLGWAERNRTGNREGDKSAAGETGSPRIAGTFRIHTPLMFRTKAESVLLAQAWGALDTLAFSHTCYEGAFPPCGRCPACALRAKGFAEAGIADPLLARAAEERTDTSFPTLEQSPGGVNIHHPPHAHPTA